MTTIIAVHGNGGGSTRFDRVGRYLPPGTRFEAVDLPGFNGEPVDPAASSVADYADHLANRIEALAGSDPTPPVVLGHGIGGSIALDLASRRPHTMAGLILHAPVGADLDRRLFPRLMSTRPVRTLVQRLIAARPLRPLWRRAFFPTGAPAEHLDTFFDGYRTCRSFGQMFEIIDAPWFEGLTPVTDVPVALLWGEHDRVLRSGQAAAIAVKVPSASTVVQPGWDHFPMLEQPEEYARVVTQLANDLAATTPA